MKSNKENNCCVLGDGSSAGDHAHVSKTTPIETKRKELGMVPAADKTMAKSTAARRDRDKASVRPL